MIFVLSLLFFWNIESAEFAKKHIMIYNNTQCFVGLMQLGKEAVCYYDRIFKRKNQPFIDRLLFNKREWSRVPCFYSLINKS